MTTTTQTPREFLAAFWPNMETIDAAAIEYLEPYVEELRADPAKAKAVRAAFLRSEVSR